MKIFYKLLPLLSIPVAMILLGNLTGSVGGKTGSTGDGGVNCTQCHAGTPQNAANWITTNIPAGGYVPGQTYTITATGTHTGVVKFGFELTAENSSGVKVGTFAITNATQTQLTNSNKAVTHKLAGTTPTGNTKTWSMNWTAPNPAVGPVTFSAAFNAANGNQANTGDVIYLTSRTVQPALMVDITFKVDMSDQTVSPLGVHIAGNFQNPPWQPGATPMNPPLIGKIYSLTIALPAGTVVQYKYINGNEWGMDESVPAACAMGGNRYFTVPDIPTTLPVVCFGSCNPCTANRDVTFRVDMSEQIVGPNGVFLAGTMNNWNSTSQPMTPEGNNIYTLTKSLPSGETIEYKFINSGTWELIPAGCAQNGNRFLLVPAEDIILDPVCFGSCVICAPPTVNVTFNVDMSYETVPPEGVHIAGDFQGWNTASTPMLPVGNNVYSVTLPLEIGNSYGYKFVNGNTTAGYEIVPPECSLGGNRSITVPATNTVLDTVCFASCDPCGPPPVPVEITFQVDMSEETVAAEGIHIAGDFQGWDPGATSMNTTGNNIYTYTVTLNSGTYHEYKFINGIAWEQAEIVPGECAAQNGNRYFTTPDVNTTLPLVCFASCEICPGPATVDITFRVDMSLQTISPDGVHLAGSFQGWNYSATPMTPQGNGIYEVTIPLVEGDYHTFKYANGNTSAKAEIVPVECRVGTPFTGYSRFMTVPGESTALDVVCFGACGPCVPPVTTDVTFQVDMSGLYVSPDGVHIAGSFQEWDPGATPMTDLGNGIYAITITLLEGEYYEYKFVNGNSWGQDESVPVECAQNNNRYITVPVENTVLDPVCFGSCTSCPPMVEVTFRVDMAEEIISPDGIHITGSFQGWNPETTAMTLTENAVYIYTISLPEGYYYEYKFINGIAWDYAEIVPEECSQNNNRFIEVPVGGTILDPVCFGSCEVCAPPTVDITFNVDMTYQEISADGVHLAGSFQGWNTSATEMLPVGNNVFAVTISLPIGNYYEYKFINGNTADGYEIVPPECSQNGNRFLTVPDINTILDTVCFSSCDPCGPPPVPVEITFQVDMSEQVIAAEGIHIAGSFQGWDPGSTLMTDAGDNIYTYTATLNSGIYYEYKFINGNTWEQAEIIPGECATQNGDRYLTAPGENTVLPIVCFASCGPCPDIVSVKFFVDMSNEVISPDGVHIAGDFQGWDPAATLMADEGGGIYSVIIDLLAGSYQTYKFINGNTFDGVEAVPAECGVDDGFGGFKRYLTIPLENTDLDVVCFGSCTTCPVIQSIALSQGWNSLSGYVMPDETDIVALMEQIYPELIIMQTLTTMYYPDGGINTIETWNSQSAYKIKVTDDVTLNIAGQPETNKTLELSEGWNLIPVISNTPVDVAGLFSSLGDNLIVVKSVAGIGVYWPDYAINTLVDLVPGHAYFVKLNSPGTIVFP